MHLQDRLIFAVVGGDIRQARLCGLLAGDGHEVRSFALDRCTLDGGVKQCETPEEACAGVRCVILPMPLSRDEGMLNAPLSRGGWETERIFAAMAPGSLALAGAVSTGAAQQAQENDVRLVDYFKREDLAVANAVPTAEGAIQIAMEELPITINDSRCLVIGNGRIGKHLSRRLRALGAETWVAARKSADWAWIEAVDCRPLKTGAMEGELHRFDVVFNTAPHLVLGRAQLKHLRSGALVVDLASKPGGVDFDAAAELGVAVKWALSLPGKVAPLTSARIIRDTVYSILQEEE